MERLPPKEKRVRWKEVEEGGWRVLMGVEVVEEGPVMRSPY
jgi:hypothetical protein